MFFHARQDAIGLAHYQISGGIKATITLVALSFAATLAILGLILYNTASADVPRAMHAVATFFLVLEAMALFLFGSARVAGCIQADRASNMLESHRQMPVPAWRAINGYLMGATSQVLTVTLLNIFFLLIMELVAGVPFDRIVLQQLVIAIFSLYLWSFTAMASFMFRQAMAVIILMSIFGGIASAIFHAIDILPAMTMLDTPFLGETIFSLGGVDMRAAYPAALGAQLAFSALFFIGACRQYRGTYLTTFSVSMGISLLAIWSLLSVLAIFIWPTLLRASRFSNPQPSVASQIVATLVVSCILILLPMHALAAWERRNPVLWGRRITAFAATLLVAAGVLVADKFAFMPWLLTCLVLTAHIVTAYALFRWIRIQSALLTALLVSCIFFALWLLPLLIEVIRWYLSPENSYALTKRDLSIISTFSPLGLLLSLWDPAPFSPNPFVGLTSQWIIAIFLFREAVRKPAPAPVTVPPLPPASPSPASPPAAP